MEFRILHCNINVFDLEKSMEFYKKALGLREAKRKEGKGFILVYMTDAKGDFLIELTWLADKKEPYDLGDNESHIAFDVDDYESAHKLHGEMGCICYENHEMGLYFIEDPDGYWLEVLPKKERKL